MTIPREQIMEHIQRECPAPANPTDWVARVVNVDTCMRPLAQTLGYAGCPACLGGRLRVSGDPESGACATCGGTGVVPLEDLP